jgi:chromate transport protein ChrA
MDQTGQFLGQARHYSALVVLNTLPGIINLNITTLSYWPVHRVLEVAVALMSAVTPGELRLVVTEVHHNCQFMAP